MNNLITFDSIFDQIMMYGVKYDLYTCMTPKHPKNEKQELWIAFSFPLKV